MHVLCRMVTWKQWVDVGPVGMFHLICCQSVLLIKPNSSPNSWDRKLSLPSQAPHAASSNNIGDPAVVVQCDLRRDS